MGAGLSAPSSAAALPQPGIGIHPVGVMDVMLGDGAEGDVGVFARLFYPAEPDEKTFDLLTREDETMFPPWIDRKEYISSLLTHLKSVSRRAHWLAEWIIGERKIRCVWKAALATSDTIPTRIPIIIFSHGVGSSRHQHSSLCSALASHGYLVAAIEHRDYSACWTYRIQTDSGLGNRSTSSCVSLRPIKQEKSVTFLDLEGADSKKEQKTRNQQVHKRMAECVRLLHFLEECDLGAVKGSCYCRTPSTTSSSTATSSNSSRSSSDEDGRRRISVERERHRCRHLFDDDGLSPVLVLGERYDWSQFTDRLDLGNVTVMGHGLGGATALACCSFSFDFQRAIILDGWLWPLDTDVYQRVEQPILFLNRPGSLSQEYQSKLPHAEHITLMEAEMHTFGDLSLLLRPLLGRRLRLNGTTDAEQMAEAVVRVCLAFLILNSIPPESPDAVHRQKEEESIFPSPSCSSSSGNSASYHSCMPTGNRFESPSYRRSEDYGSRQSSSLMSEHTVVRHGLITSSSYSLNPAYYKDDEIFL